ncbi:MetQ/NlpA family ABC transporter substrate-binding protein [Lampropedia aestuarii]|uniref:MetQ/NlpA family ABC transporter substrate-binding protein n=1 Tax=Lampropedia aestuarii TaxID=2562762 RepID=UPI00246844DF|nr:MetQ/NlpA family ABC transporter substrate-binding protein [Lampropedia aestuarii]MDH5858582.1 MetQ/NlpA family ABC transporter substrate-binding protein [Lampropedia aestuarii]
MSDSQFDTQWPSLQRRGFVTAALAAAGGVATGLWGQPALANPTPVTDKVLKVGVTSGPHEQVFEAVKKVAERDYGMKIEIVSFSDYVMPNAALDAGDLDANSFQHGPFLQAAIRARGYKLVGAGRTWVGPISLFSKKYKSLADIPEGAQISLPNDPANGGRVLLLLAKGGLITLKPGIDPLQGVFASQDDIVENPRKLKFIELESPLLVRSLDDVDAAAINADYAYKAGLNPVRDSLLTESGDSPYVCLIAVQEKNKDVPWLPQLVAAYRTQEVKDFIVKEFDGVVIPAW